MEMLPPSGWGDVATRQQLEVMERQLRSDLRGDMNEAILRMQRWTIATMFGASAIIISAVTVLTR